MSESDSMLIGAPLKPLRLSQFKLGGHLREVLDRVANSRFLSVKAKSEIYPETEDAFRERIDDRSHPGRGVWRGEFWGKWILGAVAACRYYEDADLKNFIRRAVDGLLSTQDKDGYIGTYFDSKKFGKNTWNIWCRKYTLWGLLESYDLFEDPQILRGAKAFADHMISEVGPGAKSIIETGQFFGLPSTSILGPVVGLFRRTHEKKYLDYALYIEEQWSRHPSGLPDLLRKGICDLPVHAWGDHSEEWAKSYELISCVEGLLDLYAVAGDPDRLLAARNIFRKLLEWERSPVGSVSFNDKLIGARFLKNTVAELCDVVYWNRLAFKLFCLTGEMPYLEEFERSLYNALLCGPSPDGTWGLRRLRLSHRHIPAHSHFLKHHQCCVANLPRGFFQAVEAVAWEAGYGIAFGLYLEGNGFLQLADGNHLAFEIRGDFLQDGNLEIILNPERAFAFPVWFRNPSWSAETHFQLEGEKESRRGSPGTWTVIEKIWRPGDRIRIDFDLSLRKEPFDSSRISSDDPRVAWHEKEWARMGLSSEDNLELRDRPATDLRETDAISHAESSCVFFRGPLALARDLRLENGQSAKDSIKEIQSLYSVTPPPGIWMTFEGRSSDGSLHRLCDFSSAGNTWDARSNFSAWV